MNAVATGNLCIDNTGTGYNNHCHNNGSRGINPYDSGGFCSIT